MSAPTIAEPPADTPPTPPDIQPCANEGLHRTITGIVPDRPPGGEPLWGEARRGGCGHSRTSRVSTSSARSPTAMATRTGRSSRRSATRWGLTGAWTARGAQRGGWPVLRCKGRQATPGPLELAGTAVFYARMFAGMGAGLGVGLLRHARRERVDIGREAGADLALALAGIDARVVSGAEPLWSARPWVFVFYHQGKLDPIRIMKLLRGGFTGVTKKEADGGSRKTRFGRDLVFRWGLYMKNGPGRRFPFARLDRDPPGQADQR